MVDHHLEMSQRKCNKNNAIICNINAIIFNQKKTKFSLALSYDIHWY